MKTRPWCRNSTRGFEWIHLHKKTSLGDLAFLKELCAERNGEGNCNRLRCAKIALAICQLDWSFKPGCLNEFGTARNAPRVDSRTRDPDSSDRWPKPFNPVGLPIFLVRGRYVLTGKINEPLFE